jgi:hypothetical protein
MTEESTVPDIRTDEIEDEDHPMLFNSLNPHFTFEIFIEELLSHLFFPIFLPFFIWKYGWTYPLAHGFLPTSVSAVVTNWFFPTFLLTILISAHYLPSRIGGGYIVPTCIFLIHRFMIATKYSSLSQSEYAYVSPSLFFTCLSQLVPGNILIWIALVASTRLQLPNIVNVLLAIIFNFS